MNRTHLLIITLLCVIGGIGQELRAQCTPDPTATGLVSPDTLPTACPNQFYDVTITLNIPSDTTIGPVTATIDSVVLNDLQGLPAGLAYECFPSSCGFPGGGQGCVRIFGTSTDTGAFSLDILGTAYARLQGGSQQQVSNNIPDATAIVVGLEADPVTTASSCGGSDGMATVAMRSGNGPFVFSWDDAQAQSDSIATGLAAGRYNVTVTDASGCVGVFEVNVSNTGGAVVDQNQSTIGWIGCANEDGGFIQPSVSGGLAPYAYSWSTGDSTADLDSLAAGQYTLTVTDDGGCSTTETFRVEAPNPLVISFPSQTNVSCAGEADGSIVALAGGGEGTLLYSWNTTPATNGPSLSGLAAGSYTVTVEDGIGCVKTAVATITEPDSLTLDFDITKVSTAGAGDGEVVATVGGGTPPYTYDWDGLSDSARLVGLNKGTYALTVTDDNGCTITDSVNVFNTHLDLPSSVGSYRMYPNPVQGEALHLELDLLQPQQVQMRFYDLKGHVLQQRDWEATQKLNQSLDLSEVPAGLYLLNLQVGEHRLTRRIRVE